MYNRTWPGGQSGNLCSLTFPADQRQAVSLRGEATIVTTQLNSLIKIKPWLIGVLLSTAAMFLGYTFGSDAARLLGGEPGMSARIGKGLVWGVVIAGLQWPIVRAVGVPPIRLFVAGAVGFAVGYPLGQTIQGMVLDRSLHWIWGYGSALATFGLLLGMPQWWIFRRHMQRASLWILFSVTGWMLTGVAWINFGVNSGEDSIVYGIVTGLGLVWLVHSQQPNVKVKGSVRAGV